MMVIEKDHQDRRQRSYGFVLAAGMGTRFLPATKKVLKELIPVADTPGIEMIAEEAATIGASALAIVMSPRKSSVMQYFDEFLELVTMLRAGGKEEQALRVRAEYGGSVLLAVDVDPSETSKYGVFDVRDTAPGAGCRYRCRRRWRGRRRQARLPRRTMM